MTGGWGMSYQTGYSMEKGKWNCIELMLKANEPGKRDGEIAAWGDGKLLGHWAGYRYRDIPELKINMVHLVMYPASSATRRGRTGCSTTTSWWRRSISGPWLRERGWGDGVRTDGVRLTRRGRRTGGGWVLPGLAPRRVGQEFATLLVSVGH